MAKTNHGISLDKKNQEQPTDKKRAQDSSSKNILGSGPQNSSTEKLSARNPHQRQTDDGEARQSADDIQREQLGPRGVPGERDPAKMTPQREKKTPRHIDPGHTS
ncbi:hypothetical protein [Afipia sp. Root123D2]|uniref:hypothetical protein n=1 Tax=Afipia sp. Root123D2 TaxID=1736436 RepID=UPI0009E9E683|nr:hypothetical protein [Afipia sp. Root123D2]